MIVSKAANFREKIPSLGPGHLLARPGQCPDNVQGMSRACPDPVGQCRNFEYRVSAWFKQICSCIWGSKLKLTWQGMYPRSFLAIRLTTYFSGFFEGAKNRWSWDKCMISAKLARAWGVPNEVYVPRKPPKKFRGNPAWFLFVPDFQSLKSKNS